jgi:hypothetical protein
VGFPWVGIRGDEAGQKFWLRGASSSRTFGANSYGSPAKLLFVMSARLKPSDKQLEARRESRLFMNHTLHERPGCERPVSGHFSGTGVSWTDLTLWGTRISLRFKGELALLTIGNDTFSEPFLLCGLPPLSYFIHAMEELGSPQRRRPACIRWLFDTGLLSGLGCAN